MSKLLRYAVAAVAIVAVSIAVCGATLERLYADEANAPGYDIAVGGGYAYVSGNDGVCIYDIRDPDSAYRLVEPKWAGGTVFGLWLEEETLYVASPPQGLLIADVSDPANPEIVGRYPGSVGDLFVYDEVAYIGSYGTNLVAVDVSDPANPERIASFGWTNPNGAAASGDYVYVTDPSRGIVKLDVSDRLNPIEAGTLSASGSAYRLETRGAWLLSANYAAGIRVYSLDNPRFPRLYLTMSDTGEAWDVSGEYPILCVADLQEGLEVVDASAPHASREIAADASVAPHALEYADGYVHLADQDEGYVIYRLTLDP